MRSHQNPPQGDVAELLSLGSDIHMIGLYDTKQPQEEAPPSQDDLLLQAIQNKKANKKKSWFKKVFKKKPSQSQAGPINNNSNEIDRSNLRRHLVTHSSLSTRHFSSAQPRQRPALLRRVSAPSLQRGDLNRSSRDFADLHKQYHRGVVPLEIGNMNNGEYDYDDDEGSLDNLQDQWGVGASESDDGSVRNDEEGFNSEEEEIIYADAVIVVSDEDTADRKPEAIEAVGTTGHEADSVTPSATLSSTVLSEDNDESFDQNESTVEDSKSRRKCKRASGDSARDVTESTVDLDISGSEWTTTPDDLPVPDNAAGVAKRKKKKKKRSNKISNENSVDESIGVLQEDEVEHTDEADVKKSKRKSKKNTEESYSNFDDDISLDDPEGNEFPNAKKSKRKSKKNKENLYSNFDDALSLDESEEGEPSTSKKSKRKSKKSKEESYSNLDENEFDYAEETEQPKGKKSKRRSKKKQSVMDNNYDEENDMEQQDDENAPKLSKKSKRKSRKSAADADGAEDEETSPKQDVDNENSATTAAKKKKRASIQEAAIQKGVTMLIDPTKLDTALPDDMSMMTEFTAGNALEAAEVQGEKKHRKSSRKSRKSKIHHTASTESLALATLLDDVVKTRNEWHNSLGTTSGKGGTLSQRLLHFLEKCLETFAEVSDALQLIVTFGETDADGSPTASLEDAREALHCITENYTPLLDYIWKHQLQATIKLHWKEGSEDAELNDLVFRAALVLKTLTAQFRSQFIEKGESPMAIEGNPETKMLFVTLFELLRHEAFLIWKHQKGDSNPSAFQPSAMLQQAWGVTLDSKVWHDVYEKASTAREFRRACLRFVLSQADDAVEPAMSYKALELLLEYAELEAPELLGESEQEQNEPAEFKSGSIPLVGVPKAAKLVMKNIRGGHLPRDDLVEKLLCRIVPVPAGTSEGPTSTLSVLQGRPGVGKTVIAALIAQHTAAREFYRDGVVWVRLGQVEDIGYGQYISYLKAILGHFNHSLQLENPCHLPIPGESETERRHRERKGMAAAKSKVAAFLEKKRCLIVLDHAGKNDLEWFHFFQQGEERNGATLVTTQFRGLILEKENVISVAKLGEEKDATWLLHRECNSTMRALAGRSFDVPAHEFYDSDLVKSMVQKCCLHPMAVATLGRYLSLHSRQAGQTAQDSLALTAQILGAFKSRGGIASLVEILNMSLSPTATGVPGRAIRLCLVAFVTVFCAKEQQDHAGEALYPKVPIDIVELLFESVLTLDEMTLQTEKVFYQNKKNAAELIQKVLVVLGILSDPANSSTQTTTLNHQIYEEYVQILTDSDDVVAQFAADEGKGWHRALVSNLLDGAGDWETSDSDHDVRFEYAAAASVFHMIRGGMFVEAGEMLADKAYTKRRILVLGLQASVQLQIKQVELLLATLVPGSKGVRIQSKQYYAPIIRKAYQSLIDVIAKMDGSVDNDFGDGEVSTALLDVGVSFSEWHCYEDSVACWMASSLASSMTLQVRREVLFRVATAYELLGEDDGAAAFFDECLQLQRISHGDDDIHCARTVKKIGDVLLAKGDYPEALQAYTQALGAFKKNSDGEDVRSYVGDVEEMMGRACQRQQKITAALEHYMKALQSKKEAYGKMSSMLAPVFCQIGACFLDIGKKGDAKDAFTRALDVVQTEDVKDDLLNLDYLIPKGVLAGMQGKKKQSYKGFKKAIEILELTQAKQSDWKLSFVQDALEQFPSSSGQQEA